MKQEIADALERVDIDELKAKAEAIANDPEFVQQLFQAAQTYADQQKEQPADCTSFEQGQPTM